MEGLGTRRVSKTAPTHQRIPQKCIFFCVRDLKTCNYGKEYVFQFAKHFHLYIFLYFFASVIKSASSQVNQGRRIDPPNAVKPSGKKSCHDRRKKSMVEILRILHIFLWIFYIRSFFFRDIFVALLVKSHNHIESSPSVCIRSVHNAHIRSMGTTFDLGLK